MPYQINKFNGDQLVVLQDGTLDSTTSIGLVGKNFAGYGEIQNENFLWMLENFAGVGAPPKALVGQIWYDRNVNSIKVYNGTGWDVVGGTAISSTAPTNPSPGDTWYDTTNKRLSVWDGSQFSFVGPEDVQGFNGTTRTLSQAITDDQGTDHPVMKLTVNGTTIAIVTDSPFTVNNIPGFTSLDAGINLNASTYFRGDIHGNADTASALNIPRNINGVAFDGSTNITIKSSTTNSIVAGNYITGNNFDGTNQTTWSVDATANDVSDKVVARDAAGNFSANTITADLSGNTTGTHNGPVVGNVTGNVIGTHTGPVVGNVTGNVSGNVTGFVTGNVTGTLVGSIQNTDNSVAYDEVTRVFTGSLTGNASSANKLTSPTTINNVPFDGSGPITVADITKLPLSGGILTGTLVLHQDPTQNLQAATKQYVDARDTANAQSIIAQIPAQYTITYGNTQYSTTGYTNQVGSFNNSRNNFDVFPPAGKTMADLKAFIPSIAMVHYAGGVDGNDSIRCVWSSLSDRIRVWVQNTEQRSTPAANWLAIWS
jgi:outer membrane lipoprotein SlyB